ncbi:MAG: sigma-54 dependent transcriptional regulator [Deltaproteobacteria bacterium]|nr:sigma-54 dependent transcriptional regulator [Deltaproteobacteria bacterium]
MAIPIKVLIVDDENEFRENLAEHLVRKGYSILQAPDSEQALEIIKEQEAHVALVDINLPGMNGLQLMPKLKELEPEMEVIIITGAGAIETAVEAMRGGALHYLTKPIRLKEMEMVIARAVERIQLTHQNRALIEMDRRRGTDGHGEKIIAESRQIKTLLAQAEKMAQSEMPILILGETGTGKEVFAEFIHQNSKRAKNVFSAVNCGALTDNLMDAELFGHEKGAFTGASEKKMGMIEVADGGTLFLDEIGEIPPPAQVRLLRFLERGVVRRVGATRERQMDVRVVAATHRNLEEEVRGGRFREDLFHRLHVFVLNIPPLRERQEDILPLARYFLAKSDNFKSNYSISPAGESSLLGYGWPGNVREIAHTMERALFSAKLDETDQVTPEHLRLSTPVREKTILVSLKEAERQHVQSVLDHFQGNRKESARVLGISERHLYRLIKELESGGMAS